MSIIQFKIIFSIFMQEFQAEATEFPYTTIIIILVILFFIFKVRSLRRRNIRTGLNQNTQIDRDKIILGIQIMNFFIQYSNRKKPDFLPIFVKQQNNILVSKCKKWLGFGHFYKPMYPPSKIRDFLSGLQAIEKLQLVLYTSLDRNFTQAIIQTLSLNNYFPQQYRRYCLESSQDALKHASEIDWNTKRVMILTPTHEDHDIQDSKYFLVMHNRSRKWSNFLKDSLRILKQFLESVDNVDRLHDQLMELKIEIESQSEYQFDD